jgi:ubiquinone/menaquinone biosynthesis C-methylase UbiE
MKSIYYILITFLLFSPVNSSDQPLSPEKLLLKTYGWNDLAKMPAFQGGYINFGYWKGIAPKKEAITREERIKASEALYDLVLSHLQIQADDQVVEVGSGRGNGCVKIAKTLKPALITGIDITPQQIGRTKKIHRFFLRKTPSVVFEVGSADALPLDNESCTKIFSIEAAQCFPSIVAFAKEAWRVLKPGGRLVIAAHFATGEKGYQALKKLIPTVEQGVDRLIPIQEVRSAFSQSKFKEISFENIGEFVFEGFNQWRSSVKDAEWGHNIVQAYKDGHMGYYLIVLEK